MNYWLAPYAITKANPPGILKNGGWADHRLRIVVTLGVLLHLPR
ncbi:hypothetical protein [Hyphomicrobium sp.]|nr:hypothetical protein [Hyphomicrobium sp.]HVZ05772.1 hypothetical protein [Hyphomicrobium sp.]